MIKKDIEKAIILLNEAIKTKNPDKIREYYIHCIKHSKSRGKKEFETLLKTAKIEVSE